MSWASWVDPAEFEPEPVPAFQAVAPMDAEEERDWHLRVDTMKRDAAARAKTVYRSHGPDCPCAVCLEVYMDKDEAGRDVDFPPPPFWGFPLDGTQKAPKEVFEKLAGLGEVVTRWNSPHEGKGGRGCGELLEWVGGFNAAGVYETWPRMVRCGLRACPQCGPVRDETGAIVHPGAWEVRTARRATDAILGHLEDLRKAYKLHTTPTLIHVVASPPPEAWDNLPKELQTVARLQNLHRTAIRFLKEVGVRAGYKVVHGNRIPGRFNDREEAVEGLHFHVVGLGRNLMTGWVDGRQVRDIHARTGWVIKRILPCRNDHKGPCSSSCVCRRDVDGPDPARDPFATLLYLLSHATWPTLGSLRDLPGRSYPAWCETSTRAKALAPFGDWVRPPTTVIETPLEENKSPVSGTVFAESAMWRTLWDGPPPPSGTPFLSVPASQCRVDQANRTVQVRLDAGLFRRPSVADAARDT